MIIFIPLCPSGRESVSFLPLRFSVCSNPFFCQKCTKSLCTRVHKHETAHWAVLPWINWKRPSKSVQAKSCALWRHLSKENRTVLQGSGLCSTVGWYSSYVVLGGTVQLSGKIQLCLTGGFQAAACPGWGGWSSSEGLHWELAAVYYGWSQPQSCLLTSLTLCLWNELSPELFALNLSLLWDTSKSQCNCYTSVPQ